MLAPTPPSHGSLSSPPGDLKVTVADAVLVAVLHAGQHLHPCARERQSKQPVARQGVVARQPESLCNPLGAHRQALLATFLRR